MNPASISFKRAYFLSMSPASGSIILRLLIYPASTCTMSIFNQKGAQTSGAQTAGAQMSSRLNTNSRSQKNYDGNGTG